MVKIINKIDNTYVPKWGNEKKYIAVHFLGVVGQNNKIEKNGTGAHYYIYWDGTTYQAVSDNAIVWHVGTGGYYKQLHPYARNSNTIGIEMCVKCDGDKNNPQDPTWWFTEKTQLACVELVKYLMEKYNIPIENVLMHGEITSKNCPAPYINNNKYRETWTWKEFKSKLVDNVDKWIEEDGQWWYRHVDGSCTKSDWEFINGKWYYFDENGWMKTGWIKLKDIWYYLKPNGEMATAWEWIDNEWYYFNHNGHMQTGWVHLNDEWYYCEQDGSMVTGWQVIDGKTYYFNINGQMVKNTYVQSASEELRNKYYWLNEDGEWIPNDDSWDVTQYAVIKKQ